jgi:energy-coupling factor transport system substrate-specific component
VLDYLLVLPWSLLAFLLLGLALGVFVLLYERRQDSREVPVVAALAALAAAGRIPFAAIPNVQPTTYLVLLAGFVFGPVPGFTVGATAALASNFFLGQGPWTPWQMLAWGLVGASGGWVGRLFPRAGTGTLAALGIIWGYLFGVIMNLWNWLAYVYPLTLTTFLAVEATGIWFDTMHAGGNALMALFLTKRLLPRLVRFRERLYFEVVREVNLD